MSIYDKLSGNNLKRHRNIINGTASSRHPAFLLLGGGQNLRRSCNAPHSAEDYSQAAAGTSERNPAKNNPNKEQVG